MELNNDQLSYVRPMSLSYGERCRALRMFDMGYLLSIIVEDLTSSRCPEARTDLTGDIRDLLKDRRGVF